MDKTPTRTRTKTQSGGIGAEHLKHLLDLTNEWVWAIDLAGTHTFSTTAVTDILGYTPAELVGRRALEFMHEEDRRMVEQRLPGLISAKQGWRGWIIRWKGKDGAYRVLESNGSPILDSHGNLMGFIGVDRDITVQKQFEAQLRATAEQFQRLNDNLARGMVYQIICSADGSGRRFSYLSPAVERLHGCTVEAAIADPAMIYNQVIPEYRALLAEAEAVALRTLSQLNVDVRLRLPDGRLYWHNLVSAPRILDDGNIIWDGIELDITDRKQAEEALNQSQATILSVFEVAPVGICLMQNRLYARANKYWCETFGYPEEALIGKSTRILYESDEEWERVGHELYDTFRTAGIASTETRLRRSDGMFRDVILTAAPISPEHPDQGTVVIIRDVTENKKAEAERERMQTQLIQAQKFESVGRLAGGVAHDFNNMLGVILGHVEMCLDTIKPGQEIYDSLLEIWKATERSANLTRQLLAFARKQTIQPKVLDLNTTIEGLLKMMRRLIGENIELNWQPKAGLWPVHMDASQVDQLLANLCVNARDAISGTGRVSILTDQVSLDATACASHAGASPGDYVIIAVADTGCGISAEVRSHLFEPFFTTKDIGKGTGLGLATIYGIVTQNQGFIVVDSAPGRGTTFRIHIPRHHAAAMPKQDPQAKLPARGHGKILLVEDDPGMLQTCSLMLKRLGYTVLSASSPAMALRLAQDHANSLDALVTDVIMPDSNGVELARRLRAICPGLKCLFISGYSSDVFVREKLPEDTEWMQKPFSAAALSEKLGRMLDSAKPAGQSSFQ